MTAGAVHVPLKRRPRTDPQERRAVWDACRTGADIDVGECEHCGLVVVALSASGRWFHVVADPGDCDVHNHDWLMQHVVRRCIVALVRTVESERGCHPALWKITEMTGGPAAKMATPRSQVRSPADEHWL